MKKIFEFFKNNKGTVGSVLGFASGLVASKAPYVAKALDSLAKALGSH